MNLLGHYNYFVVILLMMVGFYILISQGNLVKKVVGLNIFQTSVIIFYVSAGKIVGGTAPVLMDDGEGAEILYSNPLPHVLMLTAIVVGVATMAMALAMIVRIKEGYGTMEDDEITQMDLDMES
jgi:multicomponent Na+:H+ antiporter subunit C